MDDVANFYLFSLSIAVAHFDQVEVDAGIAAHANLNGPEGSLIADLNGVVVIFAVHVCAAEVYPLAGLGED